MTVSRIGGLGVARPAGVVTSAEMARLFGVGEDWIVSRTGISSRRIATGTEDAASLGVTASLRALTDAGLGVADIDTIVCATITASRRFPATACSIGAALGSTAPAWDLNAGCAGFLFALAQADALVRAGSARRVLVVGTDVMSKITDQADPKTAILFGDAAGAVVVEVSDGAALGPFELHSDGARPELLYTDQLDLIRMHGREVYRAAVEGMSSAVTSLLATTGLSGSDIDLVVAHQANRRILDAVTRRLGLDDSQVLCNIQHHGNTSAASIPLALFDAREQGRLQHGDKVVVTAFGAGFCWGAGLLLWGAPLRPSTPTLVGAARVGAARV